MTDPLGQQYAKIHPTVAEDESRKKYHSFHYPAMGRIVFRSISQDSIRPPRFPLEPDSTLYVPAGQLRDVSSPTDTEAAKELYPCFSPVPKSSAYTGIPVFVECDAPAAFMPIKLRPPCKPVKITSEGGSVYFHEQHGNDTPPSPSDPEHMKPVVPPFHNGPLMIVTRAELKYALDERLLQASHKPVPLKPRPVGSLMTIECALANSQPKPPTPEAPYDPMTVECALAHIQRLGILSPEPTESKKRPRDF